MESWVADALDPVKTTVLVVDVQNDFCAPEGCFARQGMRIDAGRRILAPLALLLDSARSHGAQPVYLRFVEDPPGHVISPAYDRQRYRAGEALRYCVDDWGRAIVPEVAPRPREAVVDKVRASGFFNTALDTILRCRGVTTILLTGMATESCVLATAIDATARDYYVVLVTDCLASFSSERHAAALAILEHKHPAVTADELMTFWQRRAKGDGG
ncbi:MAG TPA: isochorismatase family cysteine hydrolase [Methylomirabilota bacterium]|jgi:nicotinamidase-related amidase|nr:isochorismatase family cysteine hydrolase [Methylomirabilota bacterium]